jgi:hypothetical protein
MEIGRYCKAYLLSQLRNFPGWTEAAENARVDDPDTKSPAPRPLSGESIVYLQEDFTVTDGVFPGENVLFANVTAEWEHFCRDELDFYPERERQDSSAEPA